MSSSSNQGPLTMYSLSTHCVPFTTLVHDTQQLQSITSWKPWRIPVEVVFREGWIVELHWLVSVILLRFKSRNFKPSPSEDARIASYAYFQFSRCVATPLNLLYSNFLLRESPLMSLPLYNCSNQIFWISFSCCTPHWVPVVAWGFWVQQY